jgi:two-component system cell cycle sensor histidine kinase/response regulator CckA
MTTKLRPVPILVIDDDEDDFLMLKTLLFEGQERSFQLEWASSYESGKRALARRAHKVCFLDYRLGGQTGLDLLKETLADDYKIPIILLTGYGEHEVDLEAMRIGAADYLIKDQITPALLERSIRYAIHRAQSHENIRSLLDSTFEGIVLHDKQGLILEINRAGAQIFGASSSEMLGTSLPQYFCEESKTSLIDLLNATGPINQEAIGITKEGARLNLELCGKPYQYQDREVRLTAIRDVTSRKQMEAQILMQDRLASVGLLASSLAHEIGTPLGVIRGRAEYLAIQMQDAPPIKKNVDIIISQIDRVTHLIRSLLNLARGDQIRQSKEVNLSQIVSEVLDLMAHELRKNSIEIHNTIKASLPIHVRADAQPLHQVLLNLLVNSVHAIQSAIQSGRGGPHSIRITAKEGEEAFLISVGDTGCGISAKNMKHLFKPFFTTKGIGLGTGLGLATSYRIVESWGGKIHVESQEGFGTVFTISLPKR